MLGQLTEVRPGRRLYVQTLFGNPNGALAHCKLVALLVHGAIADSGQYDEQVKCPPLIEEGISTVTYDAYGLGQSTSSRPCDREERLRLCGPHEYYKDLLAVFDQFVQGKGFDSVLLIGHSFGSPQVVRLASARPKLIAGVVGMGCGYPSKYGRKPVHASQGPWYLRVPEWLLQLLMPVAASQLLRKVYHPHTFLTKPQLIRTAWLSMVSVKPWVMQAQCPQIMDQIMPWEEFRRLVQSVSVPGLIINKESVVPPGQSPAELMAADMQLLCQ